MNKRVIVAMSSLSLFALAAVSPVLSEDLAFEETPDSTAVPVATPPAVAPELQAADKLFALIDDRLTLARLVAVSKWRNGGLIEDAERELVVGQKAKERAAAEGLQNTERFTQAQIEFSKTIQRHWFDTWTSSGIPGNLAAPSLAGMRARLDALDARISAALGEALPSLRDPLLQARLRQQFLRRVRSGPFTDVERETLFETLLAVRYAPRVATMPTEQGDFLPADLVELSKVDRTFKLDIRYATTNNFAKRKVYAQPRAFLQRPAAQALLRAAQKLRAKGYGLIIFDGYRPWSVTKTFWEITPDPQRQFVADPNKGSRHNRGCAVDVSLYDFKSGQPLTMPSEYDDFSPRAYPNYGDGPVQARWRRDLLRQIMASEGFTVYPTEWWHFDYKDWRRYPLLDTPFEQL